MKVPDIYWKTMSNNRTSVRMAEDKDISAIREIFKSVYGADYPYDNFYNEHWLRHSIYNDDIMMLVAVDTETGHVLGTASVVFEIGSFNDLLAEFGRLAVHPEARGRGIGQLLMQERLQLASERIHVGIVENRTTHQFSQKISEKHGFVPVGYLPQKHYFRSRESMSLWVHYFGNALSLRNNHPRIVPEASRLAHAALENCKIQYDAIIDDDTNSYAAEDDFICEHLSFEKMPALLRIERGRVHNREVFGPVRLHYGFFRIAAKQADYLVAKRSELGHVAGAIGYIPCKEERSLKIVEIVASNEASIRFLIHHLIQEAAGALEADYIEADISAHSPRMQRTFVELGFLPTAYIPAMVFHQVERLDVIRMSRLLVAFNSSGAELIPAAQAIQEIVASRFAKRNVLPKVGAAIDRITLFEGLNKEQAEYIATICRVKAYNKDEKLYARGERGDALYLLLSGEVRLSIEGEEIATLAAGEALGEIAALTSENHSTTATATQKTEAAILPTDQYLEIIRKRPDIGLTMYKNLASTLGRRLKIADQEILKKPR